MSIDLDIQIKQLQREAAHLKAHWRENYNQSSGSSASEAQDECKRISDQLEDVQNDLSILLHQRNRESIPEIRKAPGKKAA
jgi:hypothetical protein